MKVHFFTLMPYRFLPYIVHDTDAEAVKEAFAPPETAEEQMEAMYRACSRIRPQASSSGRFQTRG